MHYHSGSQTFLVYATLKLKKLIAPLMNKLITNL